jgi:hypothetical protein
MNPISEGKLDFEIIKKKGERSFQIKVEKVEAQDHNQFAETHEKPANRVLELNENEDFFKSWSDKIINRIIFSDFSLKERLLYEDFKLALNLDISKLYENDKALYISALESLDIYSILEKIKLLSSYKAGDQFKQTLYELNNHLKPIFDSINKIKSSELKHAIGCLLSLIYGTIEFNKFDLDTKILTNFIEEILPMKREDIPKKLEDTCKELPNDIAKTILRALVITFLIMSVVGIPVLVYQMYKPQNCMTLFKRSPAKILREQVNKHILCEPSPEQNTFNQEPLAPKA